MPKTKVIIFGTGDVGIRVKEKLESEHMDIIAFTDNNPAKCGKSIGKIPVIPPDHILQMQFDYIAIGVYKAVGSIKQQLYQMGIEKNKVFVPIHPTRLYPNPIPQETVMEKNTHTLLLAFNQLSEHDTIQLPLKKKIINFGHNFWGFLYFVKECTRYCDDIFLNNKANEKKLYSNINELNITVYISELNNINIPLDNYGRSNFFGYSKSPFLYSMLQSNLTINFWQNRVQRPIEKELLQRLDELKEDMKLYNIPISEICIVGSTVLELFGLHEHDVYDDIDIIMTEQFRKIYGNGLIIVSEHTEVHPINEFSITDQQIIQNPLNHFLFYGFKIINLDILYEKNRHIASKDTFCMQHFYSITENRKK